MVDGRWQMAMKAIDGNGNGDGDGDGNGNGNGNGDEGTSRS